MVRPALPSSSLPLLPCIAESNKATSATKPMNEMFSDPEMANIILRCVPDEWEDQYYMIEPGVPESLRRLLDVLERIEKVMEQKEKKKRDDQQPEKKASAANGKAGARGGSKRSRCAATHNFDASMSLGASSTHPAATAGS